MSLIMLAFLIAVAALVIWAIRSSQEGQRPLGAGYDANAALRILDERFARGEIDADEYRQRRGALLGS